MSSTFSMTTLIRIYLTLLILSCISFVYVNAHSSPPRPLKRIEQPSVQAIEILPRSQSLYPRSHLPNSPSISPESTTLYNTDSFRLTLTAFEETFHLHLRPNLDLIHPAASIKYYKNGPDGRAVLDRIEPILQSNVRAYWGDVLHPDDSRGRIREDIMGGFLHSSTPTLGWAGIIVHHQGDEDNGVAPIFEGAFSVNGVIHHVTRFDNYLRTKHPLDPELEADEEASKLVIYRDNDVMDGREEALLRRSLGEDVEVAEAIPPKTCAHDHLSYNTDASLNPTLRNQETPSSSFGLFEKLVYGNEWINFGENVSLARRDDVVGSGASSNFASSIGQTVGCPLDQKIVYMGVAADCQYVQQYGSTGNATSAILNDWNNVSRLYKSTFNVSLGIIHMEIQEATCPSSVDPANPWNVNCTGLTLDNRLSAFSKWRGTKGADGAGLWHLMSGCPTGTEVGVAWLGTLCQTNVTGAPGQEVSGAAVTTAGRAEWQVVAHEIGHNFGAICVSGCNSSSTNCCPLSMGQCDSNASFIMSPTASTIEMQFSPCSLGNICSVMQSRKADFTCLQAPNPSMKILSLQMCGNGIVEEGEECDPGPGTNSTCCNAATCKFTSGAVCDPASSSCCTSQCHFAPSTQVCRPALSSVCDTPEMCTGTSGQCPWDKTKPDGLSCGDGLACASGQCTSPSRQCATVGASMELSKACDSKGDTSCQVSCQDPDDSSRCLVLQAQLIDGSPCGYGGMCMSGKCQSGTLFDTAKSWYLSNLQISIPVTVVAGVTFLLLLYFLIRCMVSCCRRPDSIEPALKAARPQRLNSWIGPPPPNAQIQRQASRPGVAPTRQMGAERVWVPPPTQSREPSIRSNSSFPRPSADIPRNLRPGGGPS
ncbi:hypothetical protein M422DRAFT_60640 [Sphaerobolus stellatus SS14]|uniref:Disintegrin and metalloproteinase domain-containing protein B n=1 Tax=Sphaerobolus stellatus (strain SS14) TaxID=990650 RepID=A0A0C9U9V4_SPHS4|nr:hypothetical protein M422DRAFT_60640 [Sphaerobolus stellatus SS14]